MDRRLTGEIRVLNKLVEGEESVVGLDDGVGDLEGFEDGRGRQMVSIIPPLPLKARKKREY
jgi:hypothetical protein